MKPFVKWVGGKRQLLEQIKKRMPEKYNNYYEPFVGGGALLFEVSPNKAIINDINQQLINVYNQIKFNIEDLIFEINQIDSLNNGKEYFYKLRDEYNQNILNKNLNARIAALFIFLNKHCFNGVYRVNKNGLFNVPYNGKITTSIDPDNLWKVHKFLQNVKIENADFATVLKSAKKDDFIFIDSPYAPLNSASFDAYTNTGFNLDDHIRLANLFKQLDQKGCKILLTNHNTSLINELYKNYKIEVIPVKRMINSVGSNRKGEEVIITNY